MAASEMTAPQARLPSWIRVTPPTGAAYGDVRSLLEGLRLGTVCREARCPNLPECWSAGTATLMMLGTECTRRCGFCAVTTHWPKGAVDRTEPARVAEAVRRWGLKYVVLTQVCRDDLEDGGASVLAEAVRAIRQESPGTLVELLVGDMGGKPAAWNQVLASGADVLAHNIETTARLTPVARDHRASYDGSLRALRTFHSGGVGTVVTKSSVMLGLGESDEEIASTLEDLREAGVDLLTLGQYLRPSLAHLPVARYVPPAEFDRWAAAALSLGFAGVASGPLVRSSYRAEELYRSAVARRAG